MLPSRDGPGIDRAPIRRDVDRRVTAAGILVSSGFVVAALASVLLPDDVRRGSWLPLHLALPGAAGVAIGSVLPFFLAALAAARPADARLRASTIAALALGAACVAIGVSMRLPVLGAGGGVLFLVGLLGIDLQLVTILGGSLGPKRGLLPRAYAWALGSVAVGATLSTTQVAGLPVVLDAWDRLKPAHAWLNVYGFVALTIATTLVHFYPTVIGTRIGLRRSVSVGLGGLAVGSAAIALGYALASDLIVRAGAVGIVVGTLAVVRFIAVAHATRFAWTTDFAWHRFTTWSLAAGVGWFVCGAELAAVRILVLGAAPVGWGLEIVGAPLAVGFVLQVLVGSWTHLVPAIGLGDPRVHARQRAILGLAATPRLVALNGGVALLGLGLPGQFGPADGPLVAGGAAATGLTLAGSVLLLLRAVRVRRDPAAEPTGE